MKKQDYNPIDYRVDKNDSEKENQLTPLIKQICFFLGFAVLVYLLYDYNNRITLIEQTFEKKLEIYKERLEKLESREKKK